MIGKQSQNSINNCLVPGFSDRLICKRVLVVGIGSHHGDDQAGWKVIELLDPLNLHGVDLRRASVPHDLIDWLDEVSFLHIVDSCITTQPLTASPFPRSTGERGARLGVHIKDSNPKDLKEAVIEPSLQLRSAGSHQLDVLTVLELAYSLKRLPPNIVLWAIPGTYFCPGQPISAECSSVIAECVEQLSKELCDA
ncbi:MAG: hypothetical protein SGI77_17040 [Pirellulaceae bacterium]|nr:hypothetical protein [Pirellulaceae bacterium]